MRSLAPFVAASVVAVALAGCVDLPEQRFVVRLLGAEGSTVTLPVPVTPEGEVPDFVMAMEFLTGSGTFSFVQTEKGPALNVTVHVAGGQDVVLAGRQTGVQPLDLTLEAGNGTYWMRSSDRANVVVVLGSTEPPECPERRLEAALAGGAWVRVPVVAGGRCPE